MLYKILVPVLITLLIYGLGWSFGSEHEKNKAVKLELALHTKINQLAEQYEKDLATMNNNKLILNDKLERELEKDIYTKCIIPNDGLRILQQAIRPR